MNRLKITIITALLLICTSAGAATLNFEYSVSGSVFSGSLVGDLQDDNDTFFVTQALELTLDDITLDVSGFYVGLFSTLGIDLTDGIPIDPAYSNIGIVSLSGQTIDLTICDRDVCAIGVVMTHNAGSTIDTFFAFFSSVDSISTTGEFNQSNWNAQVVVPLPAAGWLFLGALAGLRVLGRRKQTSR